MAEEDEALKEICSNNGLKLNKIQQEGLSCLQLEIFFSSLSKFCGLNYFPNLQKLYILGHQTPISLENIKNLTKLKELWIVESKLKSISETEQLQNLTKLILYTNHIEKIENLENFKSLTELNLNDNNITTIQNLQEVGHLRVLHLAKNRISHIGSSLDGLGNLYELDLSGNQIYLLNEIQNLKRLPALKHLQLQSDMHLKNPVCHCNNYHIYTIFHLPFLLSLDRENISNLSFQKTSQALADKKLQYYNMIFKLLQEDHLNAIKLIQQAKQQVQNLFIPNLSKLHIIAAVKGNQPPIIKEISKYNKIFNRMETEIDIAKVNLGRNKNFSTNHLNYELNSFGNITFRYGSEEDTWFQACKSLIESRFCSINFIDQAYEKVVVKSVTRVDNRMLRQNFLLSVDENLLAGSERYWPIEKQTTWHQKVEYLFHVWPQKKKNSSNNNNNNRNNRNNNSNNDSFEDDDEDDDSEDEIDYENDDDEEDEDEEEEDYGNNNNNNTIYKNNNNNNNDKEGQQVKQLYKLVHGGNDDDLLMRLTEKGLAYSSKKVHRLTNSLYTAVQNKLYSGKSDDGDKNDNNNNRRNVRTFDELLKDNCENNDDDECINNNNQENNDTTSHNKTAASQSEESNADVKYGHDIGEFRVVVFKCYIGDVKDYPIKKNPTASEFKEFHTLRRCRRVLLESKALNLLSQTIKMHSDEEDSYASSCNKSSKTDNGGSNSVNNDNNDNKKSSKVCNNNNNSNDNNDVTCDNDDNGEDTTTNKENNNNKTNENNTTTTNNNKDRGDYKDNDTQQQTHKTTHNTTHNTTHTSLVSSLCDCFNKQFDYFINNASFAVPEYIVTVRFLKKGEEMEEWGGRGMDKIMERHRNLADNFNKNFESKFAPLYEAVCEKPHDTLANKNLRCFSEVVSTYKSSTRLNLCVNNLTNVKGLELFFNLEELDLSFNQITSTSSIKSRTLKSLNLSFNKLTNVYEESIHLSINLPRLTSLDVRSNPWNRNEMLFCLMHTHIHNLTIFNGIRTRDPRVGKVVRKVLKGGIFSSSSYVKMLEDSRRMVDNKSLKLLSSEVRDAGNLLTIYDKALLLGRRRNCREHTTSIYGSGCGLTSLQNLSKLHHLTWINFDNNFIKDFSGLESSGSTLQELSLSNNLIEDLSPLKSLPSLIKLTLDHNHIKKISHDAFKNLHSLKSLSIIHNSISTLQSFTHLQSLQELYASHNRVENLRDVFFIKNLENLIIVALQNNPVTKNTESFRLFSIYHLKNLQYLDGVFIDYEETTEARQKYGGLLSKDFLIDQSHTDLDFTKMMSIDLPNSSIQSVDLGDVSVFSSLVSINLENNLLSSFHCFMNITSLKVLCLNHNRIEQMFPKTKKNKQRCANNLISFNYTTSSLDLINYPVFVSLQVLHLAYNNIKEMNALQLNLVKGLKALFLQGNQITKLEGLYGCVCLEELVLDKNKIKNLDELSLPNQHKLVELHLEENRFRSLNHLSHLTNLRKLFLGFNQLLNVSELEKLKDLQNLEEVSFVQNNLTIRNSHKLTLINLLPHIQVIDGVNITNNDRSRARTFFLEQVQQPPPSDNDVTNKNRTFSNHTKLNKNSHNSDVTDSNKDSCVSDDE